MLVSTAYLDEAERCAQVFVLHEGRLLAQGAPAQIRDNAPRAVLHRQAAPRASRRARCRRSCSTHPASIVDAVPQGGEVRFVRRPGADDDGAGRAARRRARRAGAGAPRGRLHGAAAREAAGASARARRRRPRRCPARTRPDEVVIEVKRPGAQVRRLHRRRQHQLRRAARRDLRPARPQRRGQDHHLPHAVRPAARHQRLPAGGRRQPAPCPRAGARRGSATSRRSSRSTAISRSPRTWSSSAAPTACAGRALRERMRAVLEQFDLVGQERATSGQLPGGFKQRLAMAAGLLHEPEILFLDEPTSGADPLARREFWRRITALAEAGVTVIVTTHFMEEAEYCDRIVIQDAGRLLAIGTPQQVRRAGGQGAGHGGGLHRHRRSARAQSAGAGGMSTRLSARAARGAHAQGDAAAAARPEQPGHRHPAADRADPDLRLRPVARREERAAGRGAGGHLAHRRGRGRRACSSRPTSRR